MNMIIETMVFFSAAEAISKILSQANLKRANQIHIEPLQDTVLVRFRIDGVLKDAFKFPKEIHDPVVKQFLTIADLDINEKVIPQDGTILFKFNDKQTLYWINVIPGVLGERICLFIYDGGKFDYCLDKIGMEPNQLAKLRSGFDLQKPSMVILTGPTNSGKSTAIYSMLLEMRMSNKTIVTAEWAKRADLEGIHQTVVDFDKGLSFAALCRCYLRSDIDVIFLTELTGYEDAEVAIKAVLGYNTFVFTGLHTLDAVSVINRLKNMGVEPYLITETVSIIQGQRLLRSLCNHCKEEHKVNDEVLLSAGLDAERATSAKLYTSKGCPECWNTGYSGRILAAETLQMTESFIEGVHEGKSSEMLKKIAIEEGFQTMRQTALKKMLLGQTSLAEVLRLTPPD